MEEAVIEEWIRPCGGLEWARDNDDGGDGGSVALESVVFGCFLGSLGKLAASIHQSFCS